MQLTNEVFALRDNENVRLSEEKPASGRVLAIQARSVAFPPGPFEKKRTGDGAPVEQAAIVAADWLPSKGLWCWVQLSPQTKEVIGDLLFDTGAEKDRWYYITVESIPEHLRNS